jgi:outer membrane lipoprotein SlyB
MQLPVRIFALAIVVALGLTGCASTKIVSLYDIAKNQLVWSGTVQTRNPSDINKEIKRYVDTVVDALKKTNLLSAR